ncbi:MAG: phosphatase PAP2 family protein [Prevotella sp.]|nr:phosphatase PAP2 family protein [Prevotella sp.]MBR2230060.1 phosphatase PAP2 family protein [Prevotella sp.]
MKKYMMTALLMTAAVCVQAQSKPEPYFSFRELPNMLKWAPAPPDTTGAAFTYDIMQYMWGKEMRQNKERADIAIRDAVYSLECIAQEFSEPFGLTISEENTPEIWKLLRDAKATCENMGGFPKYYYKRKRPFMRFQEPTATPQFEPDLRRNFSFPSGHTILGWTSALLLTEINPERADTILARGMMYGESRVIVGAHWQSDVDAGRLASAALYARLHTSDRFLEQMRRARQEFLKKSK